MAKKCELMTNCFYSRGGGLNYGDYVRTVLTVKPLTTVGSKHKHYDLKLQIQLVSQINVPAKGL